MRAVRTPAGGDARSITDGSDGRAEDYVCAADVRAHGCVYLIGADDYVCETVAVNIAFVNPYAHAPARLRAANGDYAGRRHTIGGCQISVDVEITRA